MFETDWTFEKVKKYKENALKKLIYSTDNIREYKRCPHCGCTHFIKYGKYQGIQRYQCKNKECRKTFSNATNSVWKYLKQPPEKWLKYIELMGEKQTLKECSFKLKISMGTAFNWRHKIFEALEGIYSPEKFKNIVRVNSHFIEKCYKGSRNKHYTYEQKMNNKIEKMYGHIPREVCVLIAMGEKKLPLIRTTEPYERVEDNFENNILYIAAKDCYVHLDGDNNLSLIRKVIKYNKKLSNEVKKKYKLKIKFNKIEDNIGKDENMTKFLSHLASWMYRFRGVATKYLNHYYNFYSIMQSEEKFDCIKLFFDMLKYSSYSSVDFIRRLHIENY